jgi:DNA polymerase family A
MPVINGHEIEISDSNQAVYNGYDTTMTYEIDEARQSLRRNDTTIYDFERGMQGAALEMTLRGFLVDKRNYENALIALTSNKNDLDVTLNAILDAIGGAYNEKFANSRKQLHQLFYDRMKIKPITRTEQGEKKYPMNRDTLEKLEDRSPWAAPIINLILHRRDITKSISVLETDIDSDWRWRCSYNIGGTKTGRWSTSKSPFMTFDEESGAWKSTGNNFQNVTEILRRVFIPDPGFKLYGIDKAQSEARDVGWYCGVTFNDWSYLDACESGDLHTYITRVLYPEWDWTGDLRRDRQIADRRFYRFLTYRDASKRLGHATNYLGQPPEISKQTRIPLDLVKTFQTRYFSAFPCIRMMHNDIASRLQRDRYLVNSFGRRRDFFDRPDDNDTLKGAVAYMFQSATADCLNLGLYRLWKYMGKEHVQILSQLHDAVYFQAPIPKDEDSEQDLLRAALYCVEVPQQHNNRTMIIPGECVGGYNWAHRFRLRKDGTPEEWNPPGLTSIKVRP